VSWWVRYAWELDRRTCSRTSRAGEHRVGLEKRAWPVENMSSIASSSSCSSAATAGSLVSAAASDALTMHCWMMYTRGGSADHGPRQGAVLGLEGARAEIRRFDERDVSLGGGQRRVKLRWQLGHQAVSHFFRRTVRWRNSTLTPRASSSPDERTLTRLHVRERRTASS